MSHIRVAVILGFAICQVASECCTDDKKSPFCMLYGVLSKAEQEKLRTEMGNNCDIDIDSTAHVSDKRKPNFMRFGRTAGEGFSRFEKSAEPNFLRFGKRSLVGVAGRPDFLRFGKRTLVYPEVVRFDKRPEELARPGFLRFGKKSMGGGRPDFLRFGRSVDFLDFD
ncbi:hypothetical protein AB6A40_006318 [Gnathostoma spinigerum]|uniref:Uncharacterized protein n=1 Tax=Gnathostoma spinigerum TaxID=75299 RepID=A0ABD6EQQ1_9BILA